jgi:hypothetical protein
VMAVSTVIFYFLIKAQTGEDQDASARIWRGGFLIESGV